MSLGETRSQMLTVDLSPPAEPAALVETAQLPATEQVQVLGERALVTTAQSSVESAPVELPTEIPKKPIPVAQDPQYQHPLMTPRHSILTPQERIAAAMQRYGTGNGRDNEQNIFDARRRHTQRVKDGFEDYSVVRALMGGYLPGFRR